jgi:hypothetical protein
MEKSGVLNGKAGVSLTLFELSRYLNDKRLEEHAFDLLQEVLVSDVRKYDFASGQAGLAYTVNYLINNKFIDADYFELFEEQHNAIIETVKMLKYNVHKSLDYIYYLFFVRSLRQYIDSKDYIMCEEKLVSLINKTLNIWEEIVDIKNGNPFHIYASRLLSLKHVKNEYFIKRIHRIQKEFEQMDYVCLYPLFPVQMYLAGQKEYDVLIRLCMDNINMQKIDFRQKTDLLIYLYQLYYADNFLDYRAMADELLNSIKERNEQMFENKLYEQIFRDNPYCLGINSGICRLILLDLFNDRILRGEDAGLLNI